MLPARRLAPLLALFFVLAALQDCAKPPISLSPKGQAAFHKTQAVKSLDLLRDIAVDANTNGLMAEGDTRKVVEYHQTALRVISATENGWEPTVEAGLDGVMAALPEGTRTRLAPYVALVKAVLKGVAA